MKIQQRILSMLVAGALVLLLAGCDILGGIFPQDSGGNGLPNTGMTVQQQAYTTYNTAVLKSNEFTVSQANMEIFADVIIGGETTSIKALCDVKYIGSGTQLTAMEVDYAIQSDGLDSDTDMSAHMILVDSILYMEMYGMKIKYPYEEMKDQVQGMTPAQPLDLTMEDFKYAEIKTENGNSIITVTIPGKYLEQIIGSTGEAMLGNNTQFAFDYAALEVTVDKDGALSKMVMSSTYSTGVNGKTMKMDVRCIINISALDKNYTINAPADADAYMDANGLTD